MESLFLLSSLVFSYRFLDKGFRAAVEPAVFSTAAFAVGHGSQGSNPGITLLTFQNNVLMVHLLNFLMWLFFKDFIYLFLERGREEEKEGNINGWLLLTRPLWGPGPQLRSGPWLRIEPATLCLSGRHSIYWATPASVHLPKF